MRLALPRDSRYVAIMRNVAGCVLSDLKAPQEVREDLELAITEACANAVKHATDANQFEVRFGIGREGCVVEVIDAGPGFDPPTILESSIDEMESGRGLFLIDALVDELQFIREPDETKIRLLKRWPEIRLPEPEVAPLG